MKALSRLFVPVLLALPMLALARPPLIYHKTVSLPAHAGGMVRLTLSSHDLVVNVKTGDSVGVTTDIWAAASSEASKSRIIKRYATRVSADGTDFVVRSPQHEGWSWHFGWGSGPQARVTVVMPSGMNLAYRLGSGDFRFDNAGAPTDIRGESGSGEVLVVSSSKRLELRAGSGDMRVKLDNGAAGVRLHAGSGDIGFSGTAGSLALEDGSGDLTVTGAAAKSATVRTGSGDIIAHWRKLAGGASIKGDTGSGDVTMYFPADTVIGGRISTGSGEVNTDFPATTHGSRHSYTLYGGNGEIRVELDAGSGDVTLRKGG